MELKNCTVCVGRYAPYKVGPTEEVGAYYCVLPITTSVRKGAWELITSTVYGVVSYVTGRYRQLRYKKISNVYLGFSLYKLVPVAPNGICQFHNPKSRLYVS